MGTWAFMAPEQRADAKGVDHLADIYSVGATLYASITGEVPKDLFAAELDPSIYRGISKPIEAVIRRACAYWSSDRYPSALAMKHDLELTLQFLRSNEADGRDFGSIQFRTNPEFADLDSKAPLRHGKWPVASPPSRAARPEPSVQAEVPKARSKPRRVNVPQPAEEEFKVGWLILGLALVGCTVFYWLAKEIRTPTTESTEILKVEIPSIKPKGRIPSDGDLGAVDGRPQLTHTDISDVALGDDLEWSVEVSGSNAYDQVQAWYRPQGADTWSRSTLRRVGDGYKGSITVDRMLSAGIEYWIEAKPYRKGLPNLTHGSATRPVSVFVH